MTAIAPGAFWDIVTSMLSPGPMIRMVSGKPSVKDLVWLAARVDSGELKPLIASTYPLDRIAKKGGQEPVQGLQISGGEVLVQLDVEFLGGIGGEPQ